MRLVVLIPVYLIELELTSKINLIVKISPQRKYKTF